MKIVLALLSCFISIASFAQTKIKLEEVNSHIGDSVEVRGKLSDITYLKNAKNSPTFIRVGGKYPNQLLTIVVFDDVRRRLDINLQEEKYAQGVVIANGKLELYKGKPQIVINDPRQLGFIYDEEVPSSEVPPIENKKGN
jgi:hypothetical protein